MLCVDVRAPDMLPPVICNAFMKLPDAYIYYTFPIVTFAMYTFFLCCYPQRKHLIVQCADMDGIVSNTLERLQCSMCRRQQQTVVINSEWSCLLLFASHISPLQCHVDGGVEVIQYSFSRDIILEVPFIMQFETKFLIMWGYSIIFVAVAQWKENMS